MTLWEGWGLQFVCGIFSVLHDKFQNPKTISAYTDGVLTLGLFKGDFWNQTKGQINYLGSNLNQTKGQIKYLDSSLMFYQIKGFLESLGSNFNQIKVQVKCRGLQFYQIEV
jgi:hypothetical protein